LKARVVNTKLLCIRLPILSGVVDVLIDRGLFALGLMLGCALGSVCDEVSRLYSYNRG